MKNEVWYITGVTSGVGLGLATVLLHRGYKVAGTSRDINKLLSKKELSTHSNFYPLQVDITNSQCVKESIEKTINHFGKITTIVNNAGYSKIGSIEEVSIQEYKELFDALYFGPLNVIKAILPYYRKEKYGYIFNVGSVGGIKTVPYLGSYGSAKYALAGLSESLHHEVKKFNIKVSYIVLGSISSSISENHLKFPHQKIEEYDSINELKLSYINNYEGKSPLKLAEIIIEYGNLDELPYNIYIGEKELMNLSVYTKIKELEEQYNSQIENNSNI